MKRGFFKRFAAAAMSAAMLLGMTTAAAPAKVTAAPDAYHDDWLHVEKGKVVDMNGNEVWMTGVNWFGYNVGSQIFDGAWSANVHHCLELISDHGFNLLRVPMSTQILLQWKNGEPDPMIKLNEYENPELTVEGVVGGKPMYSFDIWNQVVAWCREEGIKIMMDVHCATTNSAGHNYALWYDQNYSEDDWLEALAWFADYYKDDDTIIAIDLKNEPHGKKDDGIFAKWDGSSDDNNWRYGAEKGAKACLDQNPNLLIMVEGIEVYPKIEKGFDWNSPSTDYAHYGDPNYEPFYGAWWGANFRGVRDFPVDLGEHQSQLVYSPHDYGPMVWEQTWFHLEGEKPNFTSYKFDEESLLEEYWYDTWAYLVEENMYPLLMGEWGGWTDDEHDPSGANRHWMKVLRDYMIKKHIHHTFWCFNENSSDTGGLMYDNFQKWDDVKYEFVKPALWQTNDGKFISLDHAIPLGDNGISLSEYYSTAPTPTDPPEPTDPKPTEPVTDAPTDPKPTEPVTDKPTEPQPTPDTGATLLGDVDVSGKVDILDVITLNKSLMIGEKLTDQGKVNADVDLSGGAPDEIDSLNILKCVVEIIDLPA
ncbi:MAG: cellulase family glycosylhydrolase [Oscillospiraceae bacterium]|nr:cellulase family glycosylhydrolase [Oscillospiraceae bacterium]